MTELVEKYKLGAVSKNFTSTALTSAIEKLSSSDIDQFKQNTNIAALERNSEKNLFEIKRIVSSLL